MGFIGDTVSGLFGGGHKGMNFKASGAGDQPTSAILNPVNTQQADAAYNQTQRGMGQQQNFVNALTAQNGIGNQSSVFGQQQGLANLLGAESLGYGPNPALAQLNQTTGQNVANQSALMAGQRGSNANVGLMGRQIAQQGAGIQQNAVGQAAVMRAQQQLAAQQALQQQQGMMGNMAGQQVGQQAGALQGLNQYGLAGQQNILNAINAQNNANVQMQSNINSANAGLAGQTVGQQGNFMNKFIGGGLSALGSTGAAAAFMAKGGEVGPQSSAGRFLNGMSRGGSVKGKAGVSGNSLQNDTVPAMLSPGEIVLPRSVTKSEDPIGNSAKFVQAIMASGGVR